MFINKSFLLRSFEDKKKTEFLKADVKKLQEAMEASPKLMLPYVGGISLLKSKDAIRITSLFGIEFFMTKTGHDLGSDTICPAWAASSVSRNDQAFFKYTQKAFNIWLYIMPSSSEKFPDFSAASKSSSSLMQNVYLSRDAPPSNAIGQREVQIDFC